ncbi:pentatricopeptide repeat-containing protein At1g80880, mitochondrial [Ricinus communis]|uniref:Pentatricopeptide repeat-containing protein, putative n=1 Tax=Ricinus communis TaxID=3988 RepID=B9RGM1_RICCO|nr:pentatricopeptide repeat-containing protein At1g80880, mitochondrial [Ricinus communis]EEF49233.1 pentatricopeptide repeat-containing protein, putative [Ricinus communis]|eukprot:XP_002512730.1 pentatricopeptide repeat-containing protein At1g80880, mitochondrial [Ricinus communis]
MSSLISIGIRLRRSHPKLFYPLLRSTASPFSFYPLKLNPFVSLFYAAFHRTASVPFLNSLRFSGSQSFSSQNQKYPFELFEHRIYNHDPLTQGLLETLKRAAYFPGEAEAMACIDGSGVKANINLVYSVIWELRKDWKLAFLGFKWGEKWGCIDEKSCELIVWILGNHRKFNNAWIVIRDMHQLSMNIQQTMLIMIDRYAAADNPGKAIEVFNIMEKFKMAPDEEAFYSLMNALCNHGYIEEAEEFMVVNKKLFPLETEGFNVILNGWCSICVNLLEAKRVWREMSKCCITPNATSYTHMISCFSKVGNLFDSLRLYDEMKKRGWLPGMEVYNSLIYVLTRENCFKEALRFLDKMKEVGLQPDSTTYNSMIRPLCEGKKLVEARSVLATMIEENISPTMETYHALLEVENSDFEATLEVLNRMTVAGLAPTDDTFLLVLAKFFKLEQAENALKMWIEMKQYEVTPNLTHYKILVEGLVRCGLLAKARECYADMRSNGFTDDPKLQKMLKEPVRGQNSKEKLCKGQVKRDGHVNHKRRSIVRRKSVHRHPEKL